MKQSRIKSTIYCLTLLLIMVSSVISCSKKTNYIATYAHYEVDEKKIGENLYSYVYTLSLQISNFYSSNLELLNDYFNQYFFITNLAIEDSNSKMDIPDSIRQKYKNDSLLSKIIIMAKQKKARLLFLLQPKEVSSSKIYNVYFSVIDLEDDFKTYDISSVYKIDSTTVKDIFRAENKKSVKVLLKELTEIIKKTEK